MTKHEYKRYLKSNKWRQRKHRSLRLVGYKCEVCRSEVDIHVHHLSYERLGAEKDSDLIVLCEVCHTKQHDKLKLQKILA